LKVLNPEGAVRRGRMKKIWGKIENDMPFRITLGQKSEGLAGCQQTLTRF
jgi:hypothetical protein